MPTISRFFGIVIRMHFDDPLESLLMHRIIRTQALPGFRLQIEFADGARGVVELEDRLFGPVFEPLRDLEYFAKVSIDEFGAVCWPNGADLAPDAIYERIRSAIPAAT